MLGSAWGTIPLGVAGRRPGPYISDCKRFFFAVTVASSFRNSNSQICSVHSVLKLSEHHIEDRRNIFSLTDAKKKSSKILSMRFPWNVFSVPRYARYSQCASFLTLPRLSFKEPSRCLLGDKNDFQVMPQLKPCFFIWIIAGYKSLSIEHCCCSALNKHIHISWKKSECHWRSSQITKTILHDHHLCWKSPCVAIFGGMRYVSMWKPTFFHMFPHFSRASASSDAPDVHWGDPGSSGSGDIRRPGTFRTFPACSPAMLFHRNMLVTVC